MTPVVAVLAEARAQLPGAEAAADSEILLAHVLGCPRSRLAVYPQAPVAAEARRRYQALIAERAQGVPVAYLCGHREFWSLDLFVDGSVLVPRPDSELLVELALRALSGRSAPRVLDLGTGSGALGLSLATERPDASVVLVDSSPAAVAVARRNAAALGLGRVTILEGNWYAPLPRDALFDVILANPPYLAAEDPHLEGPGLAHEPRLALVAGPTGLEALQAIAAGGHLHLRPGAWLYLEHGATQGADVRTILGDAGYVAVGTHRDLAGHERATGGRVTG